MSGWGKVWSEDVTITNESTSNTIKLEYDDGIGGKEEVWLDIKDLGNIAKCIDNIRALEPNCL